MKNNYSIQLYSVRDAMKEDMATALKKIAELGYTAVEFAGFFDKSAEDVRAMLDEYGLAISGTHSPFTDLRPSVIMDTVKYHKAVGNTDYIIPGADLSTLEKLEDFVNVVNYAQPILAAEGIRLGYHNHSHEFVIQPYGSTIHAQIEQRTNVHFEIDTFWTFNAGLDSLSVLDRLSHRIHVIHLKDGRRGGYGIPLGQGDTPVADVVKYAEAKGLQMVVESETLTPSGMAEATACMDYLKSLEA
jgi:sugar phosphate isomerase/epimerase